MMSRTAAEVRAEMDQALEHYHALVDRYLDLKARAVLAEEAATEAFRPVYQLSRELEALTHKVEDFR